MQWQNTILTILDNNNASILDLLNFILRTRLPAHAHHRDALHRQTPYVLDLWLEQYPSDIVASKNGVDNMNLPETWTKASVAMVMTDAFQQN